MMPSIQIGRRDAIALRGAGAAKTGPAGLAAQALAQVTGRVATAMTAEFRLANVEPRDRYSGGTASDAYGVEDMAAALNEALGGGPADRGQIARALHEFVREGATLLAARPESGSIERLGSAIAEAAEGATSGSDVERAVAAINDAVARLQGPAR